MSDDTAIEGLKRLGLTTYEARVFIGLQKLGRGTASDVADIADVPRSQVYGAADALEEHGLVQTRRSTPTVYRPVPPEQARQQLLDELAETGAETFEYIESVQGSEEGEERTESIWMLHGREPVTSRTVTLAQETSGRLLYAIDDVAFVTDELLEAFAAAADRGVTVVVASADEAVLDRIEGTPGLDILAVPPNRNLELEVSTARFLIADDTILLSTRERSDSNDSGEEVAFWTGENAFASVLAELAEAWLEDPFG
jgi:sugar-specific transcriptional regulator TrmB